MKTSGIIAIVLLVALGGYFLLSNKSADKNTPDESQPVETQDGSTTMKVPANDSNGVDEMIVNSDKSTTEEESSTDDVSSDTTSKTVIVDYSSDGYSPKNITISVGDTVRFTNTSGTPNWPASAFHPTHTAYPGSDISKCGSEEEIFDACKTLSKGESFEFTFNEAGIWKYHNHVNVSKTGTITVK